MDAPNQEIDGYHASTRVFRWSKLRLEKKPTLAEKRVACPVIKGAEHVLRLKRSDSDGLLILDQGEGAPDWCMCSGRRFEGGQAHLCPWQPKYHVSAVESPLREGQFLDQQVSGRLSGHAQGIGLRCIPSLFLSPEGIFGI